MDVQPTPDSNAALPQRNEWSLVEPDDICDGTMLRIEFSSRPGAIEGTAQVGRYMIRLREWDTYCFPYSDEYAELVRFNQQTPQHTPARKIGDLHDNH